MRHAYILGSEHARLWPDFDIGWSVSSNPWYTDLDLPEGNTTPLDKSQLAQLQLST